MSRYDDMTREALIQACERKDRNILRQSAAIVALQTRVDMAESQAAHAMKQLNRFWWYARNLPVSEDES